MSTEPKTLFEKVWQQHVVVEPKGEPTVLYLSLIHIWLISFSLGPVWHSLSDSLCD